MAEPRKTDPLTSWIIGLIINICGVAVVGYWMYSSECQAPGFLQLAFLIVLPAVYLILMYLTLTSRER